MERASRLSEQITHPRGEALGHTLQLPAEEHYLATRQALLNQLAVLLGGRSAEEIVFQ